LVWPVEPEFEEFVLCVSSAGAKMEKNFFPIFSGADGAAFAVDKNVAIIGVKKTPPEIFIETSSNTRRNLRKSHANIRKLLTRDKAKECTFARKVCNL
jgi:hypothetical protein